MLSASLNKIFLSLYLKAVYAKTKLSCHLIYVQTIVISSYLTAMYGQTIVISCYLKAVMLRLRYRKVKVKFVLFNDATGTH